MNPEHTEGHVDAKTKRKRISSESREDGRSNERKKNRKMDRNKKEADPVAVERQAHVDNKDNNNLSSNQEGKQEVDWCRSQLTLKTLKADKVKHHRSKTSRKEQQGKEDQEEQQRLFSEQPANSLNSKSKRKSKDFKEKNKKERRRSGNARNQKEKDQSPKNKSTNEKKGKKENSEKEKLKKKVKLEEREDKRLKDKDIKEDSTWKWWEEGHTSDGRKWSSLEHRGPLIPPPYEPIPSNVNFYYNGELVKLSLTAEEVATFYAKMLDHEYTTKPVFQENFFTDWREEMTSDERALIRKLSKCDFTEINKYFLLKAEERKALTKEQKKVLKEEASQLTEEYGFCVLDGHREKIGNFRVEPPGLFRGRGEHPKMGKLKKRIQPEDITINCSRDFKVPAAPEGHRWKKVQHDDTVTWLASWVENVQGNIKYVMLNPSSKLKGEKDWQKYEVARRLKEKVETIRRRYREDWKDREMKNRQRGVALYFIDKLALRAGNEKEESETADTVGCCSLRVEHIRLVPLLDGLENVVEFDFLGKDSIRYYNKVPVEARVFKNLKLFMENKDPDGVSEQAPEPGHARPDGQGVQNLQRFHHSAGAAQPDHLWYTHTQNTPSEIHLRAVCVYVCVCSADMSLEEKVLSYNRANRAVAILCNHQRAAPKTFEKSMQLLKDKMSQKEQQLETARKELKTAQKEHKREQSDRTRRLVEKKEAAVKRLEEQLKKLCLQMTDREENKVIALGTSKLNYLDPRISVAWKFNVPIEKIYNKTHRDKFAWAIDMTDDTFTF
ncbi:DNA topoisomerase I, mitochondrial isoform X2 [Osmerus eperlanus]|uniref:DNA topoisomerase I, mitochondrial isoform X2 n=1 Tax=Osmerus eperlanus TaxID=29151 RepID=UPI002E120766